MSVPHALTLALLVASLSSATPREAAPKTVIAGSVEDADGYAVEGAFVIAQSRTTSFGETPEPARTDRAGRFHIELNDEGVHDVTVRARGYVTWRGRKLAHSILSLVPVSRFSMVGGAFEESHPLPSWNRSR